LTDALKCVAVAKITTSPGGRAVLNRKHSLLITGDDNNGYLRLRGLPLEFRARMFYKLIKDPRPEYGPYRATTLAYDYSLQTTDGAAVLEHHWHPTGLSHEVRPHIHIGSAQLSPDAVLAKKQHLLTGRITFESVLRDLIGMGVESRYDDWAELLDLCEAPHILFRSWTNDYERETGTPVAE
jgi:hypothetical protein